MMFNELFDSIVHKKIIVFFHENPASVDTLRGISAWVGYEQDIVENALNELVRHGVILENKGATTTGYAYTQDQKIVNKVARCLKACSDE